MTLPLYPRFAARVLSEALADTPVIVLQGARQVGKSTLARLAAGEGHFVTLDDPATLDFAREDPVGFVGQPAGHMLVIDEAQRAPELVLPLKTAVDADRRPGRFVLTGSADLLHVRGVSDSLAGRAETIEMMPLSQGELARRETPEDFVTWIKAGARGGSFGALDRDVVFGGGFPEPHGRPAPRAQAWFRSYVARLADHDARELQRGGFGDNLQGLLTLIASLGQAELVKSRLARSLGVAEASVDAYLRLARTMRLIIETPAWGRRPHSRLARHPKVCLLDTGLSATLAKASPSSVESPGGREFYGSLVEQFVALELTKQQAWTRTSFELWHYRHHDGLEVDLIAETSDGTVIAIEVKSGKTVRESSWRALARLREMLPDRHVVGVLLHGGETVAHLHDWLHVLPIPALWQHPAADTPQPVGHD